MNNYQKLLKAGFKIFRLREREKSIWENISGGWSLYGHYNSQAEAKRTFSELMKDEKNISM